MLLSDEEIMEIIVDKPEETLLDFSRAIESAIFAKLAAKELPEPVGAYELVVGQEEWQGLPSEIIEMRDAYSADQLRQAHAQGFAAGAAAQLSAEPVGVVSDYEGMSLDHTKAVFNRSDAYIGTPLYTRREA